MTCALCIWLINKFEDLKRPTVRQSLATVRLRLGPPALAVFELKPNTLRYLRCNDTIAASALGALDSFERGFDYDVAKLLSTQVWKEL
jgi:hypothetical protein